MKYADNNQYMVGVRCYTFNQSCYITDAMNGFTMQQTDFPFVCCVVDDASTDGEQEVIRKYVSENFDLQDSAVAYEKDTDYGHVLFAQHKTNKNCYFAVVLLKENHYSQKKTKAQYLTEWMDAKYNAMCEGDDYWTDPRKLQKQVIFLEEHADYSMCFHSAEIVYEGVDIKKTGLVCHNINDREYSSTEVFEKWIVPTASVVYRREMVDGFKMKHPEWITRGDIRLVLKCTHTGKIFGMSDKMSVYRMQPNSVSHNPAIRDPEAFVLPNHFRCIYMNFPKVDKKPVVWNISHAYYARMKKQKNLLLKFRDFSLFVYWDPKYAFKKLMGVTGFNKIS